MANEHIDALRIKIDAVNEELLRLLSERQDLSVAVAAIKAADGIPLYSHEREAQLLEKFRKDAEGYDLDPDYVEELMNVVLRHSRAAQRESVRKDGG